MSSTTIHFPPDLLASVDVVARRRGISRNRFVVAACENAVLEDAGQWPDSIFEPSLSEEDKGLLAEASVQLELTVIAGRRNRGVTLL